MAYSASVPVIRHKNRTGKDNPMSGGMAPLAISWSSTLLASNSYTYAWKPPAGTNYEIISIDARAGTVASDPSLTIGTASNTTAIVAAVNLTKTTGALTLKSTSVTSGDTLKVILTNDAGDSAKDVSVTVWGYCSVPPDAAFLRGTNHF
jgi:hypothetical protein